MFSYSKIKFLEETLTRKLQSRLKKMNTPVYIRDLFVYPKYEAQSHGEANHYVNPYYQRPRLERLIDHIEFLADLANEYHQEYFCEKLANKTYRIKPDYENHITRINLNEFALFPKGALTMGGFLYLQEVILKIARRKSANVHLLLGSIPVVMEDHKTLLNIVLYVQCGKEEKINAVCKAMPSKVDREYINTILFERQNNSPAYEKYPKYVRFSEFVSPDKFIDRKKKILSKIKTIPTNSIFTIKTYGGAEFTQAIDICFDHFFGQTAHQLAKIISSPVSNDPTILPDQIDHVVTSNIINIQTKNLVSDTVTHVDPFYNRHFEWNFDKIEERNLLIKSDKYKQMKISRTAGAYLVEHPPFGFSCYVAPREIRKMGGYHADIKRFVRERNEKAMKYAIKTYIQANLNETKMPSAEQSSASPSIVKKIMR